MQQQLRREFGDKGASLAGYIWGLQQPGVWHNHVVLDTSSWYKRRRAERAGVLIQQRAERHGFGPQVGFDLARSGASKGEGGRQAAAYLSGYLLGGKGEGAKRPLREAIKTLEPVRTIVYVSQIDNR